MANKPQEVNTIEITNFSGRLTRILNGELNSGFAKFSQSYGYDPFSKPMNLTWLDSPVAMSGNQDLLLAGKPRFIGEATPVVYAIGNQGKLTKIQINSTSNPQVNTASVIGSVLSGGATYTKGGSLEFFGSTEKIYVGSDNAVNSINFNGSSDAVVGSAANYAANVFRPMKQFVGKLCFGNGPTIATIDATGTVTSSVIGVSSAVGNIYSQLNPALGVEARVRDIDVTPDYNYLLITNSNADYENVGAATSPNLVETVATESNVAYWNGSDAGVTAANQLPANYVSALQTYLQNNFYFIADSFGAGISDGRNKLLTLPNNKPPFANATGVNGNFLFWIAPEKVTDTNGTYLAASMYYFGQLDQETPPGLYRLIRRAPDSVGQGGNIIQTPLNILASQQYYDANSSQSSVTAIGYGQHYFSAADSTNGSVTNRLFSFTVPASGTGTPQIGVYETQTQLFGRRIAIKQIRVYTEPTVANNSFRLYCIGSDGNIISDSNTGQNGFSYSYVAGSDINSLQGSLERINFNPVAMTTYALGIRIVNFGSVNMTIKKIEIDWSYSGR